MKKAIIVFVVFGLAAVIVTTVFAKSKSDNKDITTTVSVSQEQAENETKPKIAQEPSIQKETEQTTNIKNIEKTTKQTTAISTTKESTKARIKPKTKKSELEVLKEKYGIDKTYRESITGNEDYTEYCYEKLDKNGVVNPYDALKVTVENKSGKVIAKKRFENIANIEAKIDKKTAKKKAAETYSDFSIEKCELQYYMPYYPDGDIILAYRVEFEKGYVVYVNAESGELAGTDQTK